MTPQIWQQLNDPGHNPWTPGGAFDRIWRVQKTDRRATERPDSVERRQN